MRGKLILLCLTALAGLGTPSFGSAAPAGIVQQLSKTQSKVHFSMVTPFVTLSGKFNSYSGTLELDDALVPTKVNVRVDASDVNLMPVENLRGFSPEALFKTIPEPIVTFASTQIAPLGKNRYRVSGKVRRGKREWPAQFNATLLKRAAASSEFHFATEGPILDLGSQLPFPTGQTDEGTVECRLVFVRSGR